MYLLNQQVVALFAAARLAQHDHKTILNGDDRLDGQHAARNGNRFGNAAALLQILKRVKQRHQANAAFHAIQLGRHLGGAHALLNQANGVRHQRFFSNGHVRAVNHVHASAPRLSRGKRAVVGARQLCGQRDDNGLVRAAFAGLAKLFSQNLRERERRYLAGARKLVRLDQLLVELPMG